MSAKRKRPVKRADTFYEALSVPMGRSHARPKAVEQTKSASSLLTVVIAAVVIVAVAVTARSTVFVSKSEATPAGSVAITGATLAEVQLQPTQTIESYQSPRSDVQVQESSHWQAYSDAANLQGGIPAQ